MPSRKRPLRIVKSESPDSHSSPNPIEDLAREMDPVPMPDSTGLMLCTAVEEPFDDPEWIFETKFDGLRILCQFDGEDVYLFSRNGNRQELQFPEIVQALKKSLKYPALLDGEIVCLDSQGQSSFKELQQRLHIEDTGMVEARAKQHPAFAYFFDILYVDRFEVTQLPLFRRKLLLNAAVKWDQRLRRTEIHEEKGKSFFTKTCKAHGEGIVAKRKNGLYVGSRGGDWVKIKCTHRQEFVIIGYTDPKGSRPGLGALLVAYYSDDGKKLIYAGKVGTGFDTTILRDLRSRLDRITRQRAPLSDPDTDMGTDVHWVEPLLVAEVEFGSWTHHGMLRHPRFEGLRMDKNPEEVRRETPKHLSKKELDALNRYQQMRDFSKTQEPSGKNPRVPPQAKPKKPLFVIQKHHATRLHWDFRLESEGVLKSWAVTKEPSLDPSIRRLAVEVEDHPLEYARFEGHIPEGQYGGGDVEIWDKGTFDGPENFASAYESGKIHFKLHGRRLKGDFALVRMALREVGSKPQWLLIKAKEKIIQPDREIAFTHPDKIMFPEKDITKGDILEYYRAISPYLLPYLKNRPVTLERFPEGIAEDSPHFWQKNTPAYYPDWIPRAELSSETGKPVRYVLVNDLDTLLYLVNQGALTFHIWASTIDHLDHPDFVLFDLDPGDAPFRHVITLARELHDLLNDQGIPSYLKTSGKSGLHILTSWTQTGTHDDARNWALEIATELEKRCGEISTLERAKHKREGKVYLDVMQNARGHHFVPPFVLRGVPNATVSMPLAWEDLTARLNPTRFDMKSVLRKLRRLRQDPMKNLLEHGENKWRKE
ncbi:MAG: non-homologous end-joining DNA ligase [Bdellovibrionia bacterium]